LAAVLQGCGAGADTLTSAERVGEVHKSVAEQFARQRSFHSSSAGQSPENVFTSPSRAHKKFAPSTAA
jgi:hypothetical protein